MEEKTFLAFLESEERGERVYCGKYTGTRAEVKREVLEDYAPQEEDGWEVRLLDAARYGVEQIEPCYISAVEYGLEHAGFFPEDQDYEHALKQVKRFEGKNILDYVHEPFDPFGTHWVVYKKGEDDA